MDALDNLVKINKLHKEPFDQSEINDALLKELLKLTRLLYGKVSSLGDNN